MANKKRGEVEVKALGKTYILHMGANEIVSMEDALDMGINQIGEKMNDPISIAPRFLEESDARGAGRGSSPTD